MYAAVVDDRSAKRSIKLIRIERTSMENAKRLVYERVGGERFMIIGAHSVIYSANPEADQRFLRDVLRLRAVDGGGGYLIFGLPPAEASVHPSSKDTFQPELYLLCDNIEAFISEMRTHTIACGAVRDEGWGLLTQATLPGGREAWGLSASARKARDRELSI
jgi:hypothetical protein